MVVAVKELRTFRQVWFVARGDFVPFFYWEKSPTQPQKILTAPVLSSSAPPPCPCQIIIAQKHGEVFPAVTADIEKDFFPLSMLQPGLNR